MAPTQLQLRQTPQVATLLPRGHFRLWTFSTILSLVWTPPFTPCTSFVCNSNFCRYLQCPEPVDESLSHSLNEEDLFWESVTSWRSGNLEYGEEIWGMNEDALTYLPNWSKEFEAATRAFTLGNVSTRLGHTANPQQVDRTAPTWCDYWSWLDVTKVARV